MKKKEIGKALVSEDSGELLVITTTVRTKPIPIATPLTKEWCLKVQSVLKEKKFDLDDNFGVELYNFLSGKEEVTEVSISTESVETPAQSTLTSTETKTPEKIHDILATQPPAPIQPPKAPEQPKVEPIVQQLLERLNEREKKFFDTVCQKYSKSQLELAKHYLDLSQTKHVPPGLLIFRDWRKVGGERLRRVILMNEKLETFKFFIAAGNYQPKNTCVRLVTQVPAPFEVGRIIGISNRTLAMNFNDYAEIVEGNLEMRKIAAEPRVTGMEKISETDEIYTKIARAEDVLQPIDEYSSLSKVLEITKKHNVPLEETVQGILEAVYPTNDGLRLAVHIGDSLVPSARVTVWIEANRISLTEKDLHKIVRVYGYIEHTTQEWRGEIQDNLQINAYNMILEED